MRGNVLDMAVGIIVGSAFTSIVNSIVNDIFGPIVGILTSSVNLAHFSIKVGEVEIMLGSFINSVISFIIVAFVLFTIVKGFNALEHTVVKEEEPKPEPSEEVQLLTEIRDLLKNK